MSSDLPRNDVFEGPRRFLRITGYVDYEMIRKGGPVPTIHQSKSRARKPTAEKLSSSEERITVRLTNPLNGIVRRAALYRGDISKTISEALNSVNLVKVKAIDLENAGGLAAGTTIVIDRDLFSRLKLAAKERGSSMNLIINSALAKKFGYPSKEDAQS